MIEFAFVCAMAALGGCAAVGGAARPLETYELGVPDVARSKSRRDGVQILIAEPQALKALDSESIVVRSGTSIEYLAGSQWGDRLPKMVQARLVQVFENSDRFGGVGRPGEGLAIDYQVVTDIRAFEIRADATKSANVEISVKLLNDRNGIVVASKVFRANANAGSSPAGFVPALDRAFSQAASEIATWVAGKV